MKPPPEDGLLDYRIGPWTRDKLAILECYLPEFAKACRGKAPAWFYADGFAGPGVNRLRSTGERIAGSPLIALKTAPPFQRCILLEQRREAFRALQARTAEFRDRAIVERGNVNEDLLPLLRHHVPRRAPLLCLLDQEGSELHWTTVEELAEFRVGQYRAELLILFNVDGFSRMFPVAVIDPFVQETVRAAWGDDRWRPIYEARLRGDLDIDAARTRYLQTYTNGLRELGYGTVLNREIRRQGRTGQLKYILVFATTNRAGERIMDWCYDNVFPREEQLYLKGFEPPTRRDIR